MNGIGFVKEISKQHNYVVGIIVLSMKIRKSELTEQMSFSEFKKSLNPNNIVNIEYLPKDKATIPTVIKACEDSMKFVIEERIRQKRLSKGEKVALTIENNKIKIIGFTSESKLELVDGKGNDHKLFYTYSLESTIIKNSIEELEYLINKNKVLESELQAFFNRHPDFIINDDYKAIHPHIILKDQTGKKLIPDYVLELINDPNLADILDLKLPNENIFISKNRPRYSSAILKTCAQLRDYSTFFDSPENRKKVKDKYGLTLYKPNLITIIGRRKSIDPILIKNIQTDIPQLKVKTYDDIIEKMSYKIGLHKRNK